MAEAEARVGSYLKDSLSKITRISQAGCCDGRDLNSCDWKRAWDAGEHNEWEVPCQHCGKYFEPAFSGTREDGSFWGVTWDHHSLPNNDWDLAKCIPSIRFECPHCGQPTLDTPKAQSDWNRLGRYVLKGEQQLKRRGFHWEAVIDYPWDELVKLWLEAANRFSRGDIKPKLQFYQKRRAIFKDEESLLRGGLNIKRSSYEIKSDWKDEKGRALTIDRQEEDAYWATVRAWGMEESRRLYFGKVFGVAALEELRERFKVQPRHVFIDSAYMPKGDQGVYSACVKYGWVAVRGSSEYFFVHALKRGRKVQKSYAPAAFGDPGAGTGKEGRHYCNLIRFSKPQMNTLVQRLIDRGQWIEPITGESPEIEAEYNSQMASRVRRTEWDKKTNEQKVYWREGQNDHARDLANSQCLFAVLMGFIPDPCAEPLTESEAKEEQSAATGLR